jgi:YD repeat-containing protein
LQLQIQQAFFTAPNDMTAPALAVTTPPTPDLDIAFQVTRALMVGSELSPRAYAESPQALNFIPRDGGPIVRTGPDGTAAFLIQEGPAGQGWNAFTAMALGAPAPAGGAGVARTVILATAESSFEPGDGEKQCQKDKTNPGDRQKKPKKEGGDSICLFAGEKKLDITDLSIPGRGFDYDFSRTYRSQVSHRRPIATSDFGVDWAFSYSDDRLLPDGGNVIAFRDDLRTHLFLPSDTPGLYHAPMELYEELRLTGSGDFELRDAEGTVKTYRGFGDPDIPGRLLSVEDRDGNRMTFHYAPIDPDATVGGDEKHVLAYVIDTLGREIRYQYYARTGQVVAGRAVAIPHPAAETGAFGRLARLIDFKGNINFAGTAESEDFAGQANNRTVAYDYDAEGNLIAVTATLVLDTPNGNDFPEGKTTRYDYLREADIPAAITGTDRQRLLHNLTAIQAPNETALDPGRARESVTYGTNPTDPATFDRALSYTIEETNATGVPSGGTIRYSYQFASGGSDIFPTNVPFLRTTATDRRGNVTEYAYSVFDTLLEKRDFTRGFHASEPEAYVTRYRYNNDKRTLSETNPEGNVAEYTYDDLDPDRFKHGNLIGTVRTPDAARGGDQAAITTEAVYEPIYQQPSAVTDPRGLDPDFIPPIPDPSGRPPYERYTTRYFFDYQEGDPAVIRPLLAAELGVSEAEVQARLDDAGVQLGLGDLNGDLMETVDISGNVIRIEEPSVVLLPGSNQATIEGDRLQDIVTLFRFNSFGQMTSMVDPEANVHVNTFYPETDPDGDGVPTPAPADGRGLDDSTGGYLAESRTDTESNPIRNNRTNPAPVDIRNRFHYDDVGNTITVTDGRGIRTDYFVNELNQVVETTRAAAHGLYTDPDPVEPPEPLALTDFRYRSRVFYDFNNNVVLSQVEDRGNTSSVDGSPPAADLPAGVPGASDPDPFGGPAFVDTVYKYDILDNRVEMVQEVLNFEVTIPELEREFLRTRYRYDRNENQVLTILPEGNATTAIYDERDLPFQTTRGALAPPAEARLAPGDPTDYDVRGGLLCQCTTYHYDGNRNVIETVDADDTDLSTGNNSDRGGHGDRTRFVYDGFDRRTSVIDSVGNQTVYQYDPASNMVRALRFGPVGGASPTSDGPDELPGPVSLGGVIQSDNLVTTNLLEATESVHDELNRAFQTDRVLFVNTIPTMRPPDVMDGASDIGKENLTPGDSQPISGVSGVTIIGRVTTRTEYDRASRTAFTVEDDTDVYRTDYDGADRMRKTTDSALASGFDPVTRVLHFPRKPNG